MTVEPSLTIRWSSDRSRKLLAFGLTALLLTFGPVLLTVFLWDILTLEGTVIIAIGAVIGLLCVTAAFALPVYSAICKGLGVTP